MYVVYHVMQIVMLMSSVVFLRTQESVMRPAIHAVQKSNGSVRRKTTSYFCLQNMISNPLPHRKVSPKEI